MNTEEVKNLVFASLISADNPKYTEEAKQEAMYRYELEKDSTDIDWEFILEPLGASNKILELFK